MERTITIKIDGKAAEVAVERVSTAVAALFGPTAIELGRMGGEAMAYFRLRQTYQIAEKTRKLQEQFPIDTEQRRQL